MPPFVLVRARRMLARCHAKDCVAYATIGDAGRVIPVTHSLDRSAECVRVWRSNNAKSLHPLAGKVPKPSTRCAAPRDGWKGACGWSSFMLPAVRSSSTLGSVSRPISPHLTGHQRDKAPLDFWRYRAYLDAACRAPAPCLQSTLQERFSLVIPPLAAIKLAKIIDGEKRLWMLSAEYSLASF